MGGIMILTAITVSVLLWAYPSNPYVWCVLTVLIGYGIIGFVDDYRKVVRKDTKGLIARWKYFWMSVIAAWPSRCIWREDTRQPSWWCRSLKT